MKGGGRGVEGGWREGCGGRRGGVWREEKVHTSELRACCATITQRQSPSSVRHYGGEGEGVGRGRGEGEGEGGEGGKKRKEGSSRLPLLEQRDSHFH